MGKKLTKFLNALTFGHLNRKAKKQAAQLAANKNTELKLNSMELPNVEQLLQALGGKPNIISVSSTISTITFNLEDVSKIDTSTLKEICAKGVVKSLNSVTLLIGDCATALKEKMLQSN